MVAKLDKGWDNSMAMSDSALILYRRDHGDELLFAVNDNEEIYCFETKLDREVNSYQVAWLLTECVVGAHCRHGGSTNTRTWDLDDDEGYVVDHFKNYSQRTRDFISHRLDIESNEICVVCEAGVDDDSIYHRNQYGQIWCDECACGHSCMACEEFFEDDNDLIYLEETDTPIAYSGCSEGDVCSDCLDQNHEEWGVPKACESMDGDLAHDKGVQWAEYWVARHPLVKPDPHMRHWHEENASAYFEDSLHEDLGYIWESPCLKETFIAAWADVCTGVTGVEMPPVMCEVKEPDPNQPTIMDGERARPEHKVAMTALATVLHRAMGVKGHEEAVAIERQCEHTTGNLSDMVMALKCNVDPNYTPF
jgi:hypothetical protein